MSVLTGFPRTLAPLQKQCRVQFSVENFGFYEVDRETLLSRIITGDETWIHHWDPETKQESMQWKDCGSPTHEISDTTISWKDHGNGVSGLGGILFVDYITHMTAIHHGKTIREGNKGCTASS
jgi:hypothetical protein